MYRDIGNNTKTNGSEKMILNIAQQLLNNDFVPILKPNSAKPDIFCAGRQTGPNLYCVVAVDADKEGYKQKFEQTAGYLGASHSMNDYNVVILGVFCTKEEVSEDLKEFTNETVESFEHINIVKWVLTPKGVRVYGRQPDRLLNIRDILESSVSKKIDAEDITDVFEKTYADKKARIVSKNTVLTYIITGVLAFIYLLQFLDKSDSMVYDYALMPFGKGEYYRFFTCMFLHGNLEHLLSNMLALYIFGTRTERYYGKGFFCAVYFLGGLFASVISSLFLKGFALGASGAIFALMGAVFMYSLRTKRTIDGFDLYFLIFFVAVGLAGGALMEGVDNIAHIAGFIGGCAISSFYKLKT